MSSGKSTQQSTTSQSGTHFPTSFVDDYTDYFGFGFTLPQLVGATPKTTSPFGFGVGAGTGQPGGPQPAATPAPTTPEAPAAPTGPRTFRIADLSNAYDLDPEKFMDVQRLVKKGLLHDNFTIEQFDAAVAGDPDLSGRSRGNLIRARMDLERRDALLTKSAAAGGGGAGPLIDTSQGNPFVVAPSGSNPFQAFGDIMGAGPQYTVDPGDIARYMEAGKNEALGYVDPAAMQGAFGSVAPIGDVTGAFGSVPQLNMGAISGGFGTVTPISAGEATSGFTPVAAPQPGIVGAPGPIGVKQAEAAQGSLSGGDWDAFQNAQLEARYRPIERDLTARYGQERGQTQAALAQLGMLDAVPWKL